jgi:hypothetical protein
MDNASKSNRTLPQAIMARVQACALIFLDGPTAGKINQIAQDREIPPMDAAIMYTMGALKASKRRGTARNYREALDRLEAEQVGDRGDKLTRTVTADNNARYIARINRINQGDAYTPDYYQSIDAGATWAAHYPQAAHKPGTTKRSLGKVLGTLYTEWDAREELEAQLDPERIYARAERDAQAMQIGKNMRLFFTEFAQRLTRTAKTRLYEIATSAVTPGYLTSRAGQTDPSTKRESWGATRLWQDFPHRDSVSCKEFIELVRHYVDPPVMA